MLNLFGRKKADASPAAAPAPPPRAAVAPPQSNALATITELTARRAGFEEKQRHVHLTMKSLTDQALERKRKGDTQGALAFLRRRKLQEAQDKKLNAMIANLDSMIAAVDDSKTNEEFLGATKVGNAHLQREQAKVTMEALDDERDKFADIMDRQREMNDTMGQVWDPTMDVDEADAMNELDALEEGSLSAELTAPPARAAAAAARAAPAPVAAEAPLPAFAVPPSFAVPPTAQPAAAARAAPRSMDAELAELDAMT